jgi:hypothetical protein
MQPQSSYRSGGQGLFSATTYGYSFSPISLVTVMGARTVRGVMDRWLFWIMLNLQKFAEDCGIDSFTVMVQA